LSEYQLNHQQKSEKARIQRVEGSKVGFGEGMIKELLELQVVS
jgi:hypothetical protein